MHIGKLIQHLDKLKKCKALNAADKSQFKPALDLLKACHCLNVRLSSEQQQHVSCRISQLTDTLDYVGETDTATRIHLALISSP